MKKQPNQWRKAHQSPAESPYHHSKAAEKGESKPHLEPKPVALGNHTHKKVILKALGSDWHTRFLVTSATRSMT